MRLARTLLWLLFVFHSGSAFAQVSWTSAGPSAPADRVIALAADPRNDAVVYLASPGGGVWKSENGGSAWSSLTESGVPSLQFCSLAIDSFAPDVVYAGTGDYYSRSRASQGIARSPDGGSSWSFLPRFTTWPVCAIAVDPSSSSRIFAGSAEGLFASTDSGNTWRRVFDSAVTSIAFDGKNTVYVGTLSDSASESLVARSLDGGLSWSKLILPGIPNGMTTPANWVSVVVPGPGRVAVAASRASGWMDSYSSVDSGNSWAPSFAVGQSRPPVKLIYNGAEAFYYLAADTLLRSINGGTDWSPVSTTAGEFRTGVVSGGSLLVGGDQGLEAAISPRVLQQPPIGHMLSMSFNSMVPVNFWAAGYSGLFRLSLLPQGGDGRIGDINKAGAVAANANSSLIFVSASEQVFRSNNSGATFTGETVIPSTELHAPFPPLVLDPVNSTSVFVAGKNLYRSTNGGDTWTLVSEVDPDPTRVVIAMAMAPATRTTLYAATACLSGVTVSCPETSFMWRSTNSGQTWVLVGPVEGLVRRIAVDPRQTNTVYAAIGGFAGDILRSTNGGTLWASIRANLLSSQVNDILVDPSSLPAQLNLPAQTLYLATDDGVFVSFDSGAQWTDISTTSGGSLPKTPVMGLALRTSDTTLLAATYGRGAFWTSVAGLSAGVVARSLSLEVTLMKDTTVTTGVGLFNVSSVNAYDWTLEALDPWITVVTPEGNLRQRSSDEVPIEISSAGLEPGTYVGRLRLSTGSLRQTILVVAHVTPEPAQMTAVQGTEISGRAATSIPIQILLVDANNVPLPDVHVRFTIIGGGGSITPRNPSSDGDGIAETMLTLPSTPGVVTISATSGKLALTITATAVPVPSIQTDTVVDGVSYNLHTPLGAGSIISISGDSLAEGSLLGTGSPLPTLLRSTRVFLAMPAGDVALPLLSVTPTQVRALIPVDFPSGTYNLRVEVASSPSNQIPITIAAVSPALFSLTGSGKGPGIFVKADGSLVTAQNPADRGSLVTLYVAGLGTVSPGVEPGQAGNVAEPMNRTTRIPRVFFDFYAAELVYSGLAPGVAGRYHVTVRVPAAVSSSTNISVSLTIGGVASNRVTIPVR